MIPSAQQAEELPHRAPLWPPSRPPERYGQYSLAKLGERIRFLRKAKRITQEQLAEKAEMNPKYIGQIERAEINTTVITLEKIARALSVPLAELFQFEKDDPEKTNAEQLLRKLIEGRDIDEIMLIADVSRFILSKLEGKFYPHLT